MNPGNAPETTVTIAAADKPAPPAEQNKKKTTKPERLYFGAAVLSFLLVGTLAIIGFVFDESFSLFEQIVMVLLPLVLGLYCLWEERRRQQPGFQVIHDDDRR